MGKAYRELIWQREKEAPRPVFKVQPANDNGSRYSVRTPRWIVQRLRHDKSGVLVQRVTVRKNLSGDQAEVEADKFNQGLSEKQRELGYSYLCKPQVQAQRALHGTDLDE